MCCFSACCRQWHDAFLLPVSRRNKSGTVNTIWFDPSLRTSSLHATRFPLKVCCLQITCSIAASRMNFMTQSMCVMLKALPHDEIFSLYEFEETIAHLRCLRNVLSLRCQEMNTWSLAEPSYDINSAISCSKVASSKHSRLFWGVQNSLWGILYVIFSFLL